MLLTIFFHIPYEYIAIFVAPALEVCDIGVRFSVCPPGRPSVFPFTIYVDLGFQVHLNDFFSKTIASMNLKFHMQQDQTAGFQTCKRQPGREAKMAKETINSKTMKIKNLVFGTKLRIVDLYQRCSNTSTGAKMAPHCGTFVLHRLT